MKRTGTRIQVMHGNAKQTGGGLKKKDLKYNKHGKIVSKKASAVATKKMKGGGQVGGGTYFLEFKRPTGTGRVNYESIAIVGPISEPPNNINITRTLTYGPTSSSKRRQRDNKIKPIIRNILKQKLIKTDDGSYTANSSSTIDITNSKQRKYNVSVLFNRNNGGISYSTFLEVEIKSRDDIDDSLAIPFTTAIPSLLLTSMGAPSGEELLDPSPLTSAPVLRTSTKVLSTSVRPLVLSTTPELPPPILLSTNNFKKYYVRQKVSNMGKFKNISGYIKRIIPNSYNKYTGKPTGTGTLVIVTEKQQLSVDLVPIRLDNLVDYNILDRITNIGPSNFTGYIIQKDLLKKEILILPTAMETFMGYELNDGTGIRKENHEELINKCIVIAGTLKAYLVTDTAPKKLWRSRSTEHMLQELDTTGDFLKVSDKPAESILLSKEVHNGRQKFYVVKDLEGVKAQLGSIINMATEGKFKPKSKHAAIDNLVKEIESERKKLSLPKLEDRSFTEWAEKAGISFISTQIHLNRSGSSSTKYNSDELIPLKKFITEYQTYGHTLIGVPTRNMVNRLVARTEFQAPSSPASATAASPASAAAASPASANADVFIFNGKTKPIYKYKVNKDKFDDNTLLRVLTTTSCGKDAVGPGCGFLHFDDTTEEWYVYYNKPLSDQYFSYKDMEKNLELCDITNNIERFVNNEIESIAPILTSRNAIEWYNLKEPIIKLCEDLQQKKLMSNFYKNLNKFYSGPGKIDHTIVQIPNDNIIVIGDIHGNWAGLIWNLMVINLLTLIKYETINNNIDDHNNFWSQFIYSEIEVPITFKNTIIVFTGDILDRGKYDICCFLLIMKLIVLHPNNVYVCKGNHENRDVYSRYSGQSLIPWWPTKLKTGDPPDEIGDPPDEMLLKTLSRLPRIIIMKFNKSVIQFNHGLYLDEQETSIRDKYSETKNNVDPQYTSYYAQWSDIGKENKTENSNRGAGKLCGRMDIRNSLERRQELYQKNFYIVRGHQHVGNFPLKFAVSDTVIEPLKTKYADYRLFVPDNTDGILIPDSSALGGNKKTKRKNNQQTKKRNTTKQTTKKSKCKMTNSVKKKRR
jgi:hypothetical protein